MKKLVIFGSGGLARETHQIVCELNRQEEARWHFLGFLDDDAGRHGSIVHGHPVLGGIEWLRGDADAAVAVAIGNTRSRKTVVQRIAGLGRRHFPTLIHPRAWIGDNVAIGEGCIIFAGTTMTCDIVVGNHAIINPVCTIGHDAVIEDFVTVAPSASISGAVRVGQGVDVGTNATIIQGIEIGDWSILGAGAVVVRDIPPRVTAIGVPAKAIKQAPPIPGEEHFGPRR